MGKTSVDPTIVNQLKKLFVENLIEKDSVLEYGKVRLVSGERKVKSSIKKPIVFATPIGTATPTVYYSIDDTRTYEFKIISSSASDSGDAFWIAIGG